MASKKVNDKFELLREWITSNGGFINDKVSLKKLDIHNNAIVASDIIKTDEEIISIPQSLCIDVNKFTDITGLEDNNYDLNFKMLVMLSIEMKKKEESFFFPYINLLPDYKSFSYHPIFKFNNTVAPKWKQISESVTQLIETQIQTIEKYTKLYRELVSDTDDDYIKWLYLLVITRQWNSSGLVPVADLFQHSNMSTMLLTPIDNSNKFTTKADIAKNDMIYDNYGVYDDIMLYTTFGFIDKIEDNELGRFMKLTLNFNFDDSTFLNRLKQNELTLYMKQPKILYMTNLGIHNYVLEFMRIYCLNENDLKMINPSEQFYTKLISLENEARVYSTIMELIKKFKLSITKNDFDKCSKILKEHRKNSVEYHMAKLILDRGNIINGTVRTILTKWMTTLQLPYDIKLDFSILRDLKQEEAEEKKKQEEEEKKKQEAENK